MEKIVKEIYDAVVNGNAGMVNAKVQAALETGMEAETLLNDGLILPMKKVGQLYECGKFFVPEMLVAARAMQVGMTLVRPILLAKDIKPLGKIVIGTVKGDLHDIGKSLVGLMLEGAGFQMIDLGTDVEPPAFLEAITAHQPDLVCLSTLLTTTLVSMEKTVGLIRESGARVKIIVGGAPVTQAFADSIGADGYAQDAVKAVALAKKLLKSSTIRRIGSDFRGVRGGPLPAACDD